MTASDQPRSWFLHRLDAQAALGTYVSTSGNRLRKCAFIDGREQFWDVEEVRRVNIGGEATEHSGLPKHCYIFHISFCGSTLLSRLLDEKGTALVLREPQALVDLSAQQSGLAQGAPEMLSKLGAFCVRETGHLRADGETLLIKPSNWANSLIPVLCEGEDGPLAVFLSMDRADFVTAVFRGGRDRLAYTARAISHLTATNGIGAKAMQIAAEQSDDPLDQIACFAALSHRVQESIFRSAMAMRGWDDSHWIDMERLVHDPVTTAKSAAVILGLDNEWDSIEQQATIFGQRHAKDPAQSYSRSNRAREDDQVAQYHESRIRNAVDWVDTVDL